MFRYQTAACSCILVEWYWERVRFREENLFRVHPGLCGTTEVFAYLPGRHKTLIVLFVETIKVIILPESQHNVVSTNGLARDNDAFLAELTR